MRQCLIHTVFCITSMLSSVYLSLTIMTTKKISGFITEPDSSPFISPAELPRALSKNCSSIRTSGLKYPRDSYVAFGLISYSVQEWRRECWDGMISQMPKYKKLILSRRCHPWSPISFSVPSWDGINELDGKTANVGLWHMEVHCNILLSLTHLQSIVCLIYLLLHETGHLGSLKSS